MAREPVSIIVPAYNAESTLEECLGALKAAMEPSDELILFDDGSTDSTPQIAERAGVRVLRNAGEPKGPAHGRNRGAEVSTQRYLLFVDADVIIRPDAIQRLVRELDQPQVIGAFGSYDDSPRSRRLAALYANLRHHYVHQMGNREASTFWSGIGLIDKKIFQNLGGFDEDQFAHPSIEDVELGMRVIKRGFRIRLVPEAQGTHWKDWTLWRVWHTDIIRRAMPWSRLIADKKSAGSNLNITNKERALSFLALTSVFAFSLSAVFSAALYIGVIALSFYLIGIRRFLGTVSRRVSPFKLMGVAALHFFYHIYASLTFALVILVRRGGGFLRWLLSGPRRLKQSTG